MQGILNVNIKWGDCGPKMYAEIEIVDTRTIVNKVFV